MMSKKILYKPLYAGEERKHSSGIVGSIAGRSNDILLFNNPDRGYRTTMPLVVSSVHKDPDDPQKACACCDLITRNEDGTVSYNSNSKCAGKHDVRTLYGNLDVETNQKVIDYMFDRIYLKCEKTDYRAKLILLQGCFADCNKNEILPDYIFEVLKLFFDGCRKRGLKVLFRTGYHMIQYNWTVSEENRQKHEEVGASQEVMVAHIKQLAPLLCENADVLHKVSSGFIGSGGEMAYNYQYPVVDYDTIIKTVVEEICVPAGVYYTLRYPFTRISLLEKDPDYKYQHLIGFNNDAMFGEQNNWGWCSCCFQWNHNFDTVKGEHRCFEADNDGVHIKNDWWNYVCENAAYTPQSGEMFHTGSTSKIGKSPTGFHLIKETAHHRYTSMSHWNSYIETSSTRAEPDEQGRPVAPDSVVQRWIDNEEVTPEWLNDERIIYDPAWFVDENGERVHRNPYEFIRDHLGYRISLKELEINGEQKCGNTVSLDLSLVNYGFAAAFYMKSGFALLDENYNVVSSVKAGDPEKWYSHDPVDWRSGELMTHNISADIHLPSESGKYYLAFYLKNGTGEAARTANEIDFINGYTVLAELDI